MCLLLSALPNTNLESQTFCISLTQLLLLTCGRLNAYYFSAIDSIATNQNVFSRDVLDYFWIFVLVRVLYRDRFYPFHLHRLSHGVRPSSGSEFLSQWHSARTDVSVKKSIVVFQSHFEFSCTDTKKKTSALCHIFFV